jgi:hypothetical protein
MSTAMVIFQVGCGGHISDWSEYAEETTQRLGE